MAAPTIVSTTFASVPSQGTVWTVNGPDTVNEGDLLLLFLTVDNSQAAHTGSSTGSPTWPSGFAEILAGQARSATDNDVSTYAACGGGR